MAGVEMPACTHPEARILQMQLAGHGGVGVERLVDCAIADSVGFRFASPFSANNRSAFSISSGFQRKTPRLSGSPITPGG